MAAALSSQPRVAAGCTSSSSGGSRRPFPAGGRLALHTRQAAQQQQQQQRQQRLCAVVDNDEDLWQFADREMWYQAKFCAADEPEWNPARFVRSTQVAPGIREVVLECEVSREKVPLANAYKHIGQRAAVRVNSGVNLEAIIASPPFPMSINRDALLRVRGDIRAEETKTVKEMITVMAELPLFVQEEKQPELYKMSDEDAVEVGPFQGGGLQLRGPIAGVFMYPTVVIFAEGTGIAAAKALIEATDDAGGLCFRRRTDVRMYYRAPNEMAMCYKGLYDDWAKRYGVQVITSTRDTFSDMFDDDQTLMYEPDTTAAIILCGDDEEAEAAAAEVCKEAEITVVVKQSEEAARTEYLKYGKPQE